jgi:hypothetical protein
MVICEIMMIKSVMKIDDNNYEKLIITMILFLFAVYKMTIHSHRKMNGSEKRYASWV